MRVNIIYISSSRVDGLIALSAQPDRPQPDIYVNGGLLNKVCLTIVKIIVFEVNLVFIPKP